jgi:succinate dehydrogenase / fumarate reductase membrane anchor subunit
MSVVEDRPPEAPTGRPRRARRAPRNFETWSWFFMRLSGLALVFLSLIHFTVTHIVNDVVDTDYDFVAHRWDNPLWRLFDWLLLALALAHGLNGLRWIVGDYVRRPGLRRLVLIVLFGLTGLLFVGGTVTIVTFSA